MKNAHEIAREIATNNPGLRFAVNNEENMIGAWSDEKARFVVCAGKTLFGEWIAWPRELLKNGDPIPLYWVEVEALQGQINEGASTSED